MHLSIVVAVAEDHAIGRDGGLPWRLPTDLQYFKKVTLGKPVIMGRRTWEERKGRPLPGRLNIVLSHRRLILPEGVLLQASLNAALSAAAQRDHQEAAVIGGAALFAEAALCADVMHITRVHTRVPDADTFFPEIDFSPFVLAWEEAHEADAHNPLPFTFQRWERKPS
ncbi:MAG: dihydrofolate reductase [Bacteroidetes bacterium]|nr:dihydrofolate reductase [Bacteroidota bacterium]